MISDITNEIVHTIEEFESEFAQIFKNRNANLPLVIEVFKSRLMGNKKLEEIGDQFGVERERVRQIATNKLYPELKAKFSSANAGLNPIAEYLFNNYGNIVSIDDKNFEKIIKYKNIIKECYFDDKTLNNDFIIDIKNRIIYPKEFDVEKIISLTLNDLAKGKIYPKKDLINLLSDNLIHNYPGNGHNDNLKYAEILFSALIKEAKYLVDITDNENLYYYTKQERYQREIKNVRFSYWFKRLYPNGVHLPQDNPRVNNNAREVGMKNLKPLLDRVPELQSNESYRSTCNYITDSEAVITYDTGRYIHIDYIKQLSNENKDYLEKLADEIFKLFDRKYNCINVWTVFASLKDDFINSGIITHELLFGLLKTLNLSLFEYQNEGRIMLLTKPGTEKEQRVIKNERSVLINKSDLQDLRSFLRTNEFNMTICFSTENQLKKVELTMEDVNRDYDNLTKTETETTIKSRIGQEKLRKELLKNQHCCELCGIELEDILVASHIKPWKDSNDTERLDLNNVLLLCSMHDALFDKGYISFEDNGKIKIAGFLDENTQALLNIHDESKIENVSEEKAEYLRYHQKIVYKG